MGRGYPWEWNLRSPAARSIIYHCEIGRCHLDISTLSLTGGELEARENIEKKLQIWPRNVKELLETFIQEELNGRERSNIECSCGGT